MELDWLKPGAVIGSIVYALIGVIVFWLGNTSCVKQKCAAIA